jgi:hypothetical protein
MGGIISNPGMCNSIILYYGFTLVTLRAARSEKPSVVDLFRPFNKFFNVIFSAILLFLILGVGFLLLIIPGIIFACKLVFVPYLVVDKNKGVFSAISESWEMTNGHFWKIFLIGLTVYAVVLILLFIFMIILFASIGGLILYGDMPNLWAYNIIFSIIILPVNIYIMLVFSSLYHAISSESNPEIQTNNGGLPSTNSEPTINNKGSNPSINPF